MNLRLSLIRHKREWQWVPRRERLGSRFLCMRRDGCGDRQRGERDEQRQQQREERRTLANGEQTGAYDVTMRSPPLDNQQ